MQKSVHCSGCEVVKKLDSVIFTMEVEKEINNDIKVETSIWFIFHFVSMVDLI